MDPTMDVIPAIDIRGGRCVRLVQGDYDRETVFADDPKMVIGETEYGVTFASVVGRDNVVATQFHPEKSGAMGLRMYENFLRLAAGAAVS